MFWVFLIGSIWIGHSEKSHKKQRHTSPSINKTNTHTRVTFTSSKNMLHEMMMSKHASFFSGFCRPWYKSGCTDSKLLSVIKVSHSNSNILTKGSNKQKCRAEVSRKRRCLTSHVVNLFEYGLENQCQRTLSHTCHWFI